MALFNNFKMIQGAAFAVLLGVPLLNTGCPAAEQITGALCCKDFAAGADMSTASFGLEGDAAVKFRAFAQASGDLAAVSAGISTDIEGACQAMALDFGADPNDPMVKDKSGPDAVTAWCTLAAGKISASADLKAAGTLTIVASPPQCTVEASFQAKCEGGCKADVMCTEPDISARCDPGQLSGSCSAECKGTCEGSASAAAACEGSCDAKCEGSCEAMGGVAVDCTGSCSGACNGMCEGSAGTMMMSTGHCDGTCHGKCDAKCEVSAQAPAVKCTGKCTGKCQGSCKFAAMAKLKCDASCKGGCSVAYTAPKCEAKLTPPMCKGDAKCQANCNASGSARAECKPPSVQIAFTGDISANIKAQAQLKSLEVNLPKVILALKTRLTDLQASAEGTLQYSGELAVNAGAYAKAAGCITNIGTSLQATVSNMKASFDGCTAINGAIKFM